ncbi:MAG: hypothetical protein HY257_07050 [Chloroflexi bacterium]|nr:hypothetical protein [Chloroflexota bacterium]
MPDGLLGLVFIFPALAASLLRVLAPRLMPQRRGGFILALASIEIALIILNRVMGAREIILFDWQAAAFSFAFEMDGVAFLLLLALFVPLLILTPLNSSVSLDPFPFFVLSAATLLTTAASPFAIYSAWVALDLGMGAWRIARQIEDETALRFFATSQIAALIYFAGAVLVSAQLRAEGTLLIALGLWGRLGLFPFQWVTLHRGESSRDLWIARGAPLVAASSLWMHWRPNDFIHQTLIAPLAIFALIAIAVWLRNAEEPSRAVSVIIAFPFVMLPLIAWTGDAAPAFSVWLVLGNIFALILFEMALKWRIASVPIFSALWNFERGIQGTQRRAPSASEYLLLAFSAILFVGLIVFPLYITAALGESSAAAAEIALDRVVRSNDIAGVIAGFALLFAPLVAGFFLARSTFAVPARGDQFLRVAARAFDLDWLMRPALGGGYRIAAWVRNVGAVVENNPALWVLLAALWVAIFILFPR